MKDRDLKLSPHSECKILFFGLFASVNVVLSDNISKPMLVPSRGPPLVYLTGPEEKTNMCFETLSETTISMLLNSPINEILQDERYL